MERKEVEVLSVTDNPDGSANVVFDFSEEDVMAFFRAGVLQAIKNGIAQAEVLNPERTSKTNARTFEMTWDQTEAIIIKELQDAYAMNASSQEDNQKILDSLKNVLEYFMNPSDYQKWIDSL